jgi:hypothetical protein
MNKLKKAYKQLKLKIQATAYSEIQDYHKAGGQQKNAGLLLSKHESQGLDKKHICYC